MEEDELTNGSFTFIKLRKMKKYLFLPALLLLSLFLQAQDDLVIKGTKKISRQLTPQQVIDSLEKRFPNAQAVQYYKVPTGSAANGWSIEEDDNLDPNAQVDYYTLSFKNSGLKYYGLYNNDGTLIKSKVEQSGTTLPEPVKSALKEAAKSHPGYKIVSKTYYKNTNHSKSTEYYEIIAQKGSTKKRLYYSADGTLLKEK